MKAVVKIKQYWLYLMLSVLIIFGNQQPVSVFAQSGTIKYSDGDKYVGEYVEGEVKNGQGVYYCANGTTISGNWVYDYLNGKARVVYKNKDIFEGQFKYDERNGQGTYKWKNGDYYTGKWKDDVMHGKGTYTWKNKISVNGTWKNGKLDGTAYLKKSSYKYTISVKKGVLKKVVSKVKL